MTRAEINAELRELRQERRWLREQILYESPTAGAYEHDRLAAVNREIRTLEAKLKARGERERGLRGPSGRARLNAALRRDR